jgi:hypothetical protein
MLTWNPDIFSVTDLLDMLCRLPAYSTDPWRKLLEQGGPPRQIALSICSDISIEHQRVCIERQDALDRLTKADKNYQVLIQTLDNERRAHADQIIELEQTIHDLNELVARQQQKINPETAYGND